MRTLLLLILPWTAAVISFVCIEWQWREPLLFPWPVAIALGVFVVSVIAIGRTRIRWKEMAEKMVPSFLALCALSLACMLIEGVWLQWMVTVLFVGITILALKLFLLLCLDPHRYPINALSHVNIALAPFILFFLAFALNGFVVFVRLPWWAVGLACTLVCGALFLLTSHPTATMSDRLRWTLFGICVGAQLSILIQILPVGMYVHGAIGALFVGIPLRMRRYTYQPKPSRSLARFEVVAAVIVFFAVLLLARWA